MRFFSFLLSGFWFLVTGIGSGHSFFRVKGGWWFCWFEVFRMMRMECHRGYYCELKS